MGKIAIFRDLLDKGLSLEEAREQSGVSESTAKIQFSLHKKGLKSFAKKKHEEAEESEETNEEDSEDVELVEE